MLLPVAALVYQPVYDRGKLAAWVTELKGKSGVYLIKQRGLLGRVLYIGESHTGRLKKTMLRHFQHWDAETSGPTFKAGAVEVAVMITERGQAVAVQDSLILDYEPRRNLSVPASDDSNPF